MFINKVTIWNLNVQAGCDTYMYNPNTWEAEARLFDVSLSLSYREIWAQTTKPLA